MVNAPQMSLKVIVIAHFVLTVWASMTGGFLPNAYIYMNAFVLAFGVWSIIAGESLDAILLYLVLNLISIVMDIIFLGIFTSHAQDIYENPKGDHTFVNTFRFSLGMAIVNLLLRPFTSFILYRLYQDRGGHYSDFGIPNMPSFGPGSAPYENIDHSVPSNNVESASPHRLADHEPLTP